MPELPHILKSIYQLENFVTGPGNRMAFAAAKRVADEPGQVYNPLVIHGGVGLGKTHLLQAIGNAAAAAHPDWSIVMLSGSQVIRQDLESVERADLLLIDDLHLGVPDRDVQIRLIPLFDSMIGTGRQIAATTDVPPQKMEALDQKLLSRLMGGVIVGLKEIDINEKTLILAKKAVARGVQMTEDILLTIASRVPSNVRELEGALNRVLLYASLFDGQVTKAIVDEALPPTFSVEPEAPAGQISELAEEGGGAPEPETAPPGEFGDFLTGLDTKVTALITEEQDAEKLRQECKEKLYIWKMKGFNTARAERALDQDISIATREYEAFTANIERLITLQEEFGGFYRQASQEEIAAIESLLFDPDKVDDLHMAVEALHQRLAVQPPPAPEPSPTPTQAARLSQVISPQPPLPSPVPAPSTTAAPPAPKTAVVTEPRPIPAQAPRPAQAPAPAPVTAPPPEPPTPAPAAEKVEFVKANLGFLDENWPRLDDRLMEEF